MATSTPNIDLVPKEALEQLKELDKQLDTTTKGMKDMLTQVQGISNSLSSSAKNYQELVDAVKALNAAGTTYAGTTRRQKTIMEQLAVAEKRFLDLKTKEYKDLAKLKVQIQEQNKANKDAAKAVLAHANSLDAMRAKLSQMKAEAGKLDVLSDEFKKLTADISKLNAEVSKHEQSMGVYGRNVGNYSSAFGNLQHQIQQVARELPSLTIGASQFFLAVSNNLPMLVDELNRAREANKKLRADGKETVPVFTQMLKGIVSWQTALVVGITLLSTYGKEIGEWVKGLFNAGDTIRTVSDAQNKLNDEIQENGLDIGDDISKLKELQARWNDLGDSLQEKKKFIEENKDAFNDLGVSIENTKDAENLLENNSENFIKTIMLRAQALAASKLAAEKYEKAIKKQMELEEAIENGPSFWKSLGYEFLGIFSSKHRDPHYYLTSLREDIKELMIAGDKFIALNNKLTGEANKLSKESGFKPLDKSNKSGSSSDSAARKEWEAYYKILEERLKRSAEVNKAIVEDENESYDRRKQALKDYTNQLKESIKEQAKAQKAALPKGEDTTNRRLLIEEKERAELEKIDRDSSEILKGIEKQRVNDTIKEIQRESTARARATDLEEKEAYRVLASKGIKNEDEYEREKTKIAQKYALKRFEDEKAMLENILSMENLSNEERAKVEQQLEKATFDYKMYLLDQEIKEEDRKNKKSLELEKLTADKRKELLQSVYDFANTLIMARFENQLKALDEESEANQEWADEETERIERLEESGAISKEQAEARKAAIDDQAQAREEEIERKKREILRKQAIYEKAQTIASITWNTAAAIMKTAQEWGFPAATPFIAMAAAAGALQTATVLATPIPEYAEGTDDHPGGLAVVGDGGKSEMIISGGKIYKTPAVDTLVDLPKHAVVLPDFSKAVDKLPEKPNNHSVIKLDNGKLETYSMENNKLLKMLIVRMERDARNAVYDRELNRLRPTKR